MAKPLDQLSPAYRRRIERAMAQGKSRQAARGHEAREHISRKEREIEKYGGLTIDQTKAVARWAEKRRELQRSNAALNPDDLIAWTQDRGFDKFKKLRSTWERERRGYKNRPRKEGERKLDSLWEDADLDDGDIEDLGVEWLYYH